MAALREFHRILNPGGRFSIAEPIFRDGCVSKRFPEDNGPTPCLRDPTTVFFPFFGIDGKLARFLTTEEKIARVRSRILRSVIWSLCADAGFVEIHPGISY